ncbi:MAG: hypothetical protein CMH31_04720 [Micavibrio sp.]|nr:hypothetical protein [Micavibrio sp.]|tara:strand:+ start:441 stop:1202 length:762 start_codon:yes stop_codon:yes gene_type:complete
MVRMINPLKNIAERVKYSLLAEGEHLNPTGIDKLIETTLHLYSASDTSETNLILLLQRFELCQDLNEQGYNIPNDVITALFFQGIFQDPSFPARLTGEYSDITADFYTEISLIREDAYADFVNSVNELLSTAKKGQRVSDDHKSALLLDINNSFLAGERNDYLSIVAGIARRHLSEGVTPEKYVEKRTEHLRGIISRNFIFHTDPFGDDLDLNARENMRWETSVIEDIVQLAGQIKRASQVFSPNHRTHLLTP